MRGDLVEKTAADVCRELAAGGDSGILAIDGPGGPGRIVFADGRIIAAVSPTPRARLGDRLVGAGELDPEDLSRALAAQQESGGNLPLGSLLVERGLVRRDAVRVFVQEQVLDALFEIIRWRYGAFAFEADDSAREQGVPLSLSVDDALVEVARRQQEWNELSQVIPDLEAVPSFRTGAASASAALEPDEFAVLASVDGARSVRALAADLGYGEFEAARIVYGLSLLGIVDVRLPQDEIGAALDDALGLGVVEDASEPAPEPRPERALEPIAEQDLEPIAEQDLEPIAEQDLEPIAEQDLEPEPEPEHAAEPATEQEHTPEPAAEHEPEPAAEHEPEPLTEHTPEPLAEYKPEPLTEHTPEPLAEYEPEPLTEDAPEPEREREPEVELESTSRLSTGSERDAEVEPAWGSNADHVDEEDEPSVWVSPGSADDEPQRDDPAARGAELELEIEVDATRSQDETVDAPPPPASEGPPTTPADAIEPLDATTGPQSPDDEDEQDQDTAAGRRSGLGKGLAAIIPNVLGPPDTGPKERTSSTGPEEAASATEEAASASGSEPSREADDASDEGPPPWDELVAAAEAAAGSEPEDEGVPTSQPQPSEDDRRAPTTGPDPEVPTDAPPPGVPEPPPPARPPAQPDVPAARSEEPDDQDEPAEAPRQRGDDQDVSEFLRELSRLSVDGPKDPGAPKPPIRSSPRPSPPSSSEQDSSKKKRRGLFGRG